MSAKDYITKVLDMEDVILKNIEEDAREITITLELAQKVQLCPACGAATSRVHDYRHRTIRDLELRGKRMTLQYQRRRYLCTECGNKFAEKCAFAGRYQRFTHRITAKNIDLLHRRSSLKAIAEDTGISLSGVNRILNALAVPKPETLPEAISFDEFKGNLEWRTLPVHCHRSYEPSCSRYPSCPHGRNGSGLSTDISEQKSGQVRRHGHEPRFSGRGQNLLSEREDIIIDRFHVVRFWTQAMDNIRKSVQKQLPDDQRKYFKRSRRLLLAHREKFSDEDKTALDVMLRFSNKLAQGYALKEAFYHFMAAPDKKEAGRRLDFWLDSCDRLRIPEFRECRRMLRNWKPYILNAFDIRLSNGFTEGCNNAIKTLKRASFGCQSFSRFRKKILLSFSLHPYI